ncbi:hypothetical protein Taro_035411 [Colocasia esculenta]|uniref:Transposase Tnp1/En/Spm-like domain-containing protein n=1 Tax=Colocasia esculenta TaxID=4460 RepID=A0A843W3R2_COLES|nr:hypothetical protein [Colocasia esculenta]
MWREAVKVWTSSAFRRRSEINTKNKSVQTMFHCAGTRSFADIRQVEKEKTGTDPDRADVFIITHTRKDGRPINENCAIAIEKRKALKQTQPSTNSSNPVVAKDDAFSKNESQVRRDSPWLFASSMASKECASSMDPNVVSGTRNNKMTRKKVKLLDLENEQVAEGIVMSIDPKKIVMGRPIGHVYCEVLVDEAKQSLFSG